MFSFPKITTYWNAAYPLMYYFIGNFLKEKQFKVKIYLLLAIVCMCIIQTLLFKFPVIPDYGVENFNNLGCVVITVSIFLLFYNLKINKDYKKRYSVCKGIRFVANTSMATFLLSSIFESLTHEYFASLSLNTFSAKLPCLAYLTPIKFVASVLCGIVVHLIADLIFKLVKVIIEKIKRKPSANS